MAQIRIKFPDGSEKEYPRGTPPASILAEMGGRLQRECLTVKINGKLADLSYPIQDDASIVFLTADDEEGLAVLWHSTSHIMAHAVKSLYPEARFGVGPSVTEGFYYDIKVSKPFGPDDLTRIEDEMQNIIKSDSAFRREELSKEEAIALFKDRDELFKIELLEDLKEPPTIYHEDGFVDLCIGPHIPSTGRVKYFKLLSVAGAYWRGNENNPMLQRIYGISFTKKSQFEEHLHRLEEAKKRDHRKLGRELDLFSINDDSGPGLVLWHPKGALIRHIIEDFWYQEHLKGGYELVNSPHIARLSLWEKSGHLDFFSENMFSPMDVDSAAYQVKPMNCPFHLLIYKSKTKSYRDLPIRWAELGTVYRYERSGVLHGLMRVRGFTQDDAHIFCRPDQLDDEILRLLDFSVHMLKAFGFQDYDIYLSTRPEKHVGTLENWERATEALRSALVKQGLEFEIDPGEGVFYGPKIDIKIRDVLGRSWQCTTLQVDFNEPERFNIHYTGKDGQQHRPIMIHRALLGSLERFFGVLIEHYAGAFPLWLAPVQVSVIPITDKQVEYAKQVHEFLLQVEIRSNLDDRSEKVGFKIREAEVQKIPYMLIIGQKEVDTENVSLRKRGDGDLGVIALGDFIKRLKSELGPNGSD